MIRAAKQIPLGATVDWDGLTITCVTALEDSRDGFIWVTGESPTGRMRSFRLTTTERVTVYT